VDGERLDRIVRRLAASVSRRGILRFLVVLGGWFALQFADESEAGKGTGGRKGGRRHGRNRTRRHARQRRHRHKRKQDKPKAACSADSPDGACDANQLCVDGACHDCTVTCDGDPGACGNALQAAIDAAPSEPVVVFPGGAVTIEDSCRVTENTAPAGQGGGMYADSQTIEVTLESEQIVTDNVGGNCAGVSIDNCVG
jgi:hypothetical protein